MGVFVIFTARSRIRIGLLIAILGLAACGSANRGRSPARASRDITLVAKNQNFYDATLHAIGPGGSRQLIGRVMGNSEESFVFRWSSVELRIEIELLSVGSTVTEPLPVDEGDELELIITPDLHRRIP
jgi:hypothetical protein